MEKKLTLTFDSGWVLGKRDEEVLPVAAFLEQIRTLFEVEVLDSSFTDCSVLIKNPPAEEEIYRAVYRFLQERFSLEQGDSRVKCSLCDWQREEKPVGQEEVSTEEKAPLQSQQAEGSGVEEVREKIRALVGAEEFKALAEECVQVAPGLIKHNTVEAFSHQCYLFSVNDGYGCSTYLELFKELLEALKLLKFADRNAVAEEVLPLPRGGMDGDESFRRALSAMNGMGGGKVLCLDISEWMNKVGDKSFRDFLRRLEVRLGQDVVVFRVPFVEREILEDLKKAIGDVLFVRSVSFVPFDREELKGCAENLLAKRGFSMEENAWELFFTRINEEKTDGRFYGGSTLNKVIREMLYHKQLHNALHGVDDCLVKREEILGLAASYSGTEKSGEELLDSLIGMESVKQKVLEVISQIESVSGDKSMERPCIHMRFVGNPGTGKTTVARVIGKILKEKGLLRNGSFFEISGRDLCGRYVGETAPKTAAICRDAYGSVLFIDEAYSLYRADGFSGNADYGREAIDTLIAEMENHRRDLVVIMAGYTDEMGTLMKANAGLESRMPYTVEFPNYTREELSRIFMQMAKKSFTCGEGFSQAVEEYFCSLPEELVGAKEFSNARFVRNLFERTWGKAVLRAQLHKDDSKQLLKEDFLAASAEREFRKIMEKPIRKNTLGFLS